MPSRSSRWRVALLVAALVVLAGCGGGGGGDAAPSPGGPAPDGADGGAPDPDDGQQGSDGGVGAGDGQPLAVASPALVRTGQVDLRVEDYGSARGTVERAVRERDGYVSDSSQQVHRDGNRTWTTGTLVLRVPSERFGGLVERVKGVGEVAAASTSTEDVSDRIVDLEARLANLRAQRDRLRGLYRNASDTEALLSVGERLSEVQGEIERLEADLAGLEDRVAYSTLTVDLTEPRPDARQTTSGESPFYETGVLTAFGESVHGVVVVVRALLVAAAYGLPYALVFGVPALGGFALYRRWNWRDQRRR